MTTTLERRRVAVETPRRRERRPLAERVLMAGGALLLLLVAAIQLAPSGWPPAQLGDAAQLACFTFGGLAFGLGAAWYAERAQGQHTYGFRAALAPAAGILALIAFVVAIIAALVWIL